MVLPVFLAKRRIFAFFEVKIAPAAPAVARTAAAAPVMINIFFPI